LYRVEPSDGAAQTSQRQEPPQPRAGPQLHRRDDGGGGAPEARSSLAGSPSDPSTFRGAEGAPWRPPHGSPGRASEPVVQDGWDDEDGDDLDILDESPDSVNDELPIETLRDAALGAPAASGSPSTAVAHPASTAGASPDVASRYLVDQHQQVPEGWTYDPETDIVPTRKRWSNPYPDRRLEVLRRGALMNR
jgi:hypothetical protein